MTASPSPTSATSNIQGAEATTLSPDYRLASVIVGLGLGLGLVQLWVGLGIVLLGGFLVIQTTVIRLTFTAEALHVCRGATILRQFPYADWATWTIFWSPVPILFYFREVNSIHFLPMLFSPTELREQLSQHCVEAAPVD